jgi:ABC-type transport system involved in cytochrome bd biosynthesis fused ATPase/permease subunit
MWNIIISTIVFVIAVWAIRRYLDDLAMPKGIARGLLVFVLAYVISWVSGELVDWAREKMFGPEPVSQVEQDLTQVLKDSGITLP